MLRVAQEDRYGCVVACLAMITGQTYQEVKADFGGYDFDEKRGVCHYAWDDYLIDRGFALQRRWKYGYEHPDYSVNVAREPWPPEPFGPVHLCEVIVTPESPSGHMVVMLGDGAVLDPCTPDPRRLADYHEVSNVAAVYRVGQKEEPC